MSTHIHIEDLQKSYGSNKILKGINLEIRKGEFVSLLGASGSGKTTLLRCFAGLEAPDPDSGKIRLGDRVLSGPGTWVPPEKRNLGMVFQNYAVWPHMTVAENVAFPLKIRSQPAMKSEQVTAKVQESLGLVKLDKLADRYAHQLSGGQQQRVALARALAMSPHVLLLDEPLSNLDALLREELGAEIRRLQQALGLTTILVTHDQKEALSLSDRIVLLSQGHIEAQGAPEDLYANPPTDFAAEFLSGGESVKLSDGSTRLFLPRRWKVSDSAPKAGRFGDQVEIVSRIFLGNEYEYWAKGEKLSSSIRFFSEKKFEMNNRVNLEYFSE